MVSASGLERINPINWLELSVFCISGVVSSGPFGLWRLWTEFDDSYSSCSLVMGGVSLLAKSSSSSSSSSSSFFAGIGSLSAGFSSILPVWRVSCFFGAGAELLVPVLFYLGVPLPEDVDDPLTLLLSASFCLARACSFAIFSSLARHSAM